MKKILTVLFLTVSVFSLSQTIDSSAFYRHKDDMNIDSIIYRQQFYNSGQIKEEGWVFFSSKTNDLITFDSTTNFDCFSTVEFKIGKYKFYHKNGTIECILNNPTEISDTGYMFVFNSKKKLISEVKFIESPIVHLECYNHRKNWHTIITYKYYHFKNYSKEKIILEGYYVGSKKNRSGYWKKYNKNGQITKERFY